jgi:hypothetical protein
MALGFHPFFFDFSSDVDEQYYSYDDVEAFAATTGYISLALQVYGFIQALPIKYKTTIRPKCMKWFGMCTKDFTLHGRKAGEAEAPPPEVLKEEGFEAPAGNEEAPAAAS